MTTPIYETVMGIIMYNRLVGNRENLYRFYIIDFML